MKFLPQLKHWKKALGCTGRGKLPAELQLLAHTGMRCIDRFRAVILVIIYMIAKFSPVLWIVFLLS